MNQTPLPAAPSALPPDLRRRALLTVGPLVAINLLLWAAVLLAARRYPVLLSGAALAYGFGLRHAVDADHISAIDNTTRKLMADGQRPLGVGLFFSLGHSTIVVLLCAALALATGYVQKHLPAWQAAGLLAGTVTSGVFLYLIGFLNLLLLLDLFQRFRAATRGDAAAQGHTHDPYDANDPGHVHGGPLARLLRPLLGMVRRSRHMYVVGFLFGLGFDTATEVGILALSARSGGDGGTPFWAVMLLPLLFTAGMCLVDTLDGILMLGVYGWAFVRPVRKLYYNLTITLLSVLTAFVIGTYELLGVLQERFHLAGPFWDALARLPFDNVGYLIVAMFALGWGLSALLYRWRWQGREGTPA